MKNKIHISGFNMHYKRDPITGSIEKDCSNSMLGVQGDITYLEFGLYFTFSEANMLSKLFPVVAFSNLQCGC